MRSSDWLPMETATLNPCGQAYGPTVLIWCAATGTPIPAYYAPMHGWKHRDTGPAWVVDDGVGDDAIAPEDAVAWMPIVAPWSKAGSAGVKKSLTVAEPVMPAELWCTAKKSWHFTDGYGTRYVRGDLAYVSCDRLSEGREELVGTLRDLLAGAEADQARLRGVLYDVAYRSVAPDDLGWCQRIAREALLKSPRVTT